MQHTTTKGKTSFIRKGTSALTQQKRITPPQGSRLSPQNGQLLISSGLPDLDGDKFL
jgi:hypothetical protein